MFCREHVVQLHQQIDRIHGAGAELVVVGNGKPHFVKGFRELTRYDGPLFTDPTLAAYRAAELNRSAWRLVTPKAALNAVRAMARGFFQGRVQGDALQQGGVMIIVPPDRVAWQHTSEVSGDNAPPDEVIAELEKAVRRAA
jgi:hypothetical protein